MKPSEFYEKYWKVYNADGTVSDPNPLTAAERDFMDNPNNCYLDNCYLEYFKTRSGQRKLRLKCIEKNFNQLPEFLKNRPNTK